MMYLAVVLIIWLLVSVILGLLVGRALTMMGEAPRRRPVGRRSPSRRRVAA